MTPTNPILRRIVEERQLVQEQLLAGPPSSMTAEQVGSRYLAFQGRYQVLTELETFVRETLQKGDYIDTESDQVGNKGD